MDCDIVIAGGGPVGTTLGLALAQAGLTVMLVEPQADDIQKNPAFDGRAYALSISSQRLLAAIGLWSRLGPLAQPILDIRISDARPGQGPSPLTLAFDHAEIEEGPMGYLLEDRHLRPALIEAAAATPGLTRLTGVTVTDHVPGPASVTVTLSDGSIRTAAALAACDGAASPAARRAGIRRQGWDYDQSSLVAALAHERPHHGMAHQQFLPAGPLAILPLPGNRCSIVWTQPADCAAAVQALEDDAYLAVLRPIFGDFLGPIRLEGTRYSYPLSLSLAETFHAPRLALVGDAAHRVHPIAGQGLNAGLKDVGALAQVLVTALRRGEDPGRDEVLARYTAWRRFDTATLAAGTDAVNRLFSNDNPALRLARDLGLAAVGGLPPLRRALIREAAGLTGEVPRLNRGLTL
jgi:2-octaprenyl-6-methoxyphenol hydroxylase